MLGKAQRLLLEDKLRLWRQQASEGPMEMRDYHHRAAEALETVMDYADDLRDRLHDLVMVDSEEWAIGGGPGFKARRDAAWARAREPFEP